MKRLKKIEIKHLFYDVYEWKDEKGEINSGTLSDFDRVLLEKINKLINQVNYLLDNQKK